MSHPVWVPKSPQNSKMAQFIHFINQKHQTLIEDYQQLQSWSVSHPELFWPSICAFFDIKFDNSDYQVINEYEHMIDAQWFLGATFNFANKLLSRRDEHPALICINENQERQTFSYQQLYLEVAQCAAGLKALGIKTGDRIAAVLPNTAYAVIGMLATASIGAIWSSCSPDFGAQAAIDRLGQINPRVLFVCDGHQYQGKKYSSQEKLDLFHLTMPSLEKIILCPNIGQQINSSHLSKLQLWQDFIKTATVCNFVSLPFAHPLYILFSSGTTGKPKCIVHGAGGTLIQHVKELGLHTDLSAQDNLCFYTTCGWMMWNWTVSALALGATLTLYEGSPVYPEAYSLVDIIDKEQVSVFGTSAKYLSSLEKSGVKPIHHFKLDKLRCILSTGSPLLHKSYDFVYQEFKEDVQLSSISGGTDIISCFALGNPILPIYRGELQCLGLGMAVAVLDEQGQPLQQGRGELVCTKAFPSMPIGFWNDPLKKVYQAAYFDRFPGVWSHGDFAMITEHKGLIIYGRSDAVLNPGGIRIGTAEIYRQVEKIDAVLDSIVVGQEWEDDVRIVLFVTLREGVHLDDALCNDIRRTIRQNASPRHVPAKIIQVKEIPRTINGKIVEIAVRQAVHGQEVTNLQSLANPHALEDYKNRTELQY